MQLIVFVICILFYLFPVDAYAYVGPGLGLGALGAILGLVFSIFLAVIAIIWYPIKRLIGRFQKKNKKEA